MRSHAVHNIGYSLNTVQCHFSQRDGRNCQINISTIWQGDQSWEMREKSTVKKDSFRFCFLLFLPCFKSVFSVKTSFQSKSCLASLYQAWGGSTESSPAWAQPISNGQYSCRKSCLAEFQISLNKLLYAHALIVSVQSSSWKLILKAANICIDSVVLFENESSQAEKEKKEKKKDFPCLQQN